MYIGTQIALDTKGEQPLSMSKGRQWSTLLFSPLWPCLLLALGIRIFLIIHTHGVVEGDEALVGIQAERILRGEFPVYFYGQPYMGSLEAYLVASLFALFGPSVWALRTEAALLSLLLVWLTWRLAGALAAYTELPRKMRLTFMSVAALCAALPPLYDGVLELHMLGGYIETFVLMILLLLCALQLTRRWRAGARYRELIWRWLGIGFVVGLGLWVDPLIASAVLAAGLWILGNCLLEMRRCVQGGEQFADSWWRPARELLFAVAALPSCLLGMAPALGWGATHQWANVAYILNLSGHQTLMQKISNTLHMVKSFGSCIAPRLVGGALPLESPLLLTLHTGLFFIGLLGLVATGLLFLGACVRPNSSLGPVRQLVGLPALFALCSIGLFCTSPASMAELQGCTNDWAGRYAAPAALMLPFFLATAFTLGWFFLRSMEKSPTSSLASTSQISKRRLPLFSRRFAFVQGVLLVLLLGLLGTQALTYSMTSSGQTYQSNYCTQDPFDNGPILTYLQEQHVRYIWANNFLAYPLVFKSQLSIIGADPLPLTSAAAVNRIPSYTDTILRADRPTMLFVVPHTDRQPRIFQALEKLHVTYSSARFSGQPNYDVLVVTPISRTVSPLELTQYNLFICMTS